MNQPPNAAGAKPAASPSKPPAAVAAPSPKGGSIIAELSALWPKSETVADIAAAIETFNVRRVDLERRLENARTAGLARYGETEWSENESNIDRLSKAVRYVTESLTELADQLVNAKEVDTKRALYAQLEEIGAARKVAAFVKFWREVYPVHAAAIAGGLETLPAAEDAFNRSQHLVAQLRDLGEEVSDLIWPSYAAVGPLAGIRSLAEAVKLCGSAGAPHVPFESVQVERHAEVFQALDSPANGPRRPGTPPPGRMVPCTVLETRRQPVRNDKPVLAACGCLSVKPPDNAGGDRRRHSTK